MMSEDTISLIGATDIDISGMKKAQASRMVGTYRDICHPDVIAHDLISTSMMIRVELGRVASLEEADRYSTRTPCLEEIS